MVFKNHMVRLWKTAECLFFRAFLLQKTSLDIFADFLQKNIDFDWKNWSICIILNSVANTGLTNLSIVIFSSSAEVEKGTKTDKYKFCKSIR